VKHLRAFAAFWYDFIIGDDWRVALGVVAALGLTYALAHNAITAWWLVPAAVIVLLPLTLWRAIRKG
jgi:hypothetical protein